MNHYPQLKNSDNLMQLSDRKKRGAFFTGVDVAAYLVKRVLNGTGQKILEPSFGEGVFIEALASFYKSKNSINSLKKNVIGVEVREEPVLTYRNKKILGSGNLINSDFLATSPRNVDVVVGNPPFISLKRISSVERERANGVIDNHGFRMPANGSLWLPFLLHSIDWMKQGGSLGFVLPFEITYVRYALQLWEYLAGQFENISVIRVHEDLFPRVNVETVLLILEGKGGSTTNVNYEIYKNKRDLDSGKTIKKPRVLINSILAGDRPFISSMLNNKQTELLKRLRADQKINRIDSLAKFKIGYVSGDQKFFHPTKVEVENFNISDDFLLPAVPNARVLKETTGLEIKDESLSTRLFYPTGNQLSKNIQDYIDYGEKLGIDKKYKTSNREPWYLTPSVEIPDLILTVFGDLPRMYINNGDYAASNSLLCGYLRNGTNPTDIALSWYNSLTLLSVELKVHSLGGGVLIFIPGETDAIEMISQVKLNGSRRVFKSRLDRRLIRNKLSESYQLGDEYVLPEIGLSRGEIILLKEGVELLQSWRNTSKRKNASLRN